MADDRSCAAHRTSPMPPGSSLPLVHAMELGPLRLATNLWLAPLAGWTSLGFRELVRELGGVGLAMTEVVSAPELLAGGRRCRDYTATSPADRPLAVQINARTAVEAREGALRVQARGFEAVDFNLGCPVRKITKKGGGAALGSSAEQVYEVVRAAVEAVSIPVTAKIRLGWDEHALTGPEVARALEAAGVSALTVHGRTRAQAFAGQVDREGIRRVVEAVRVPVVANGDVLTVACVRSMLVETGAAGVMVGRGAIENPWVFSAAVAALGGGEGAALQAEAPAEVSLGVRIAFARRHFDRLCATLPPSLAARQFRKVLRVYVLAAGGSEQLAAEAVVVDGPRDVDRVLDMLVMAPLGPPRSGGLVKTPKRPVDHW